MSTAAGRLNIVRAHTKTFVAMSTIVTTGSLNGRSILYGKKNMSTPSSFTIGMERGFRKSGCVLGYSLR